jgi:DNA-binding MarR family transcriptional regulator
MRIDTFLRQSPLFAIRRASRLFDTYLGRILKSGDTSFMEALVLVSILFEEPKAIKPSELADTLAVTRGNVSHCISTLEAKGLVRRRIDPADARAIHVVMKPEGRTHAMRVIRTFDRLQKDFERHIGASELQAALSVIGEVERLFASRASAAKSE